MKCGIRYGLSSGTSGQRETEPIDQSGELLNGVLAQPLFPQNCIQVFISPLALEPNVLDKVSFPPHPQST
jgi:hypothetical protein